MFPELSEVGLHRETHFEESGLMTLFRSSEIGRDSPQVPSFLKSLFSFSTAFRQ